MVYPVTNCSYKTNSEMRRTTRIFLVYICMCLVYIGVELKTDGISTANGCEDDRSCEICKLNSLHILRSPEISLNIIYNSVLAPLKPRVSVA